MSNTKQKEPSFFDFLKSLGYTAPDVQRMDLRRNHIVTPFEREIAGARVLDLAAHDGRWSYAFAGAGAKEVVAIEGRQELVDEFGSFPDSPFKNAVKLSAGDIFEFCRAAVAKGEQFDVVAILGIFYHIMSHYDLLLLASRMKPKLILIDSTFLDVPHCVMRIQKEPTDLARNAIPYFAGQRSAPIGIISLPALNVMAESIGYSVKQVPWSDVPAGQKGPVKDYFRPGNNRRFTFELRPKD